MVQTLSAAAASRANAGIHQAIAHNPETKLLGLADRQIF
jgi:hypothetical protein